MTTFTQGDEVGGVAIVLHVIDVMNVKSFRDVAFTFQAVVSITRTNLSPKLLGPFLGVGLKPALFDRHNKGRLDNPWRGMTIATLPCKVQGRLVSLFSIGLTMFHFFPYDYTSMRLFMAVNPPLVLIGIVL